MVFCVHLHRKLILTHVGVFFFTASTTKRKKKKPRQNPAWVCVYHRTKKYGLLECEFV